jgi:hypothetical protein
MGKEGTTQKETKKMEVGRYDGKGMTLESVNHDTQALCIMHEEKVAWQSGNRMSPSSSLTTHTD